MSQLFFAPRLNWAQSWWILKRSEICEISNFLNFAKPRQIIESAQTFLYELDKGQI